MISGCHDAVQEQIRGCQKAPRGKYADALSGALAGRAIVSLEARTKEARKWLHENEQRIRGKLSASSLTGKRLLGLHRGGFFFLTHTS